jgi:4'-phosphopantetheinyl transferase
MPGVPFLQVQSVANRALTGMDVHVWSVPLNQSDLSYERLSQTLSADEIERAGHFLLDRDRRRYIVARAVTRTILGWYLRIPPKRVEFWYGPYGKPSLAAAYEENRLTFNLAHSHELMLCAVTRGRDLGIDIEHIQMINDIDLITETVFAPGERANLRALGSDHKLRAFYACWTRKEAYIKATGRGLSQQLDRFEVSVSPDEPPALLRVEGHPHEARRWMLIELSPTPEYAAALAVESTTHPSWRLHCSQWPDYGNCS